MKKGFAKMFGRGESGTALIEFAVLLPVFLILVFAVIGFGYAYVIYEAEGRAVSSTGRAIQNDSYLNNTNSTYYTTEPGVLQTDADNIFGAPLALFNGTTGNSICAQAYAQNAVPANPSNYCSGNTWKIQATDASVTPGTTYFVAIYAQVTPTLPLPDLYSWMVHLPLNQSSVVSVGNGGVSGVFGTIQVLDPNQSSWTVPSGITKFKATVVGAGGGGGSPTAGDAAGAGGGGSGAIVVAYFSNVPTGQSFSYSVGSGGSGGYTQHNGSDPSTTGGNGGATTFDCFVAGGGTGGQENAYFVPPGGTITVNTCSATATALMNNGGFGDGGHGNGTGGAGAGGYLGGNGGGCSGCSGGNAQYYTSVGPTTYSYGTSASGGGGNGQPIGGVGGAGFGGGGGGGGGGADLHGAGGGGASGAIIIEY